MTTCVAVTGKGGVGKTTFAALLIRYLLEKKKGDILAVDADPNTNLNEVLGLDINMVIADVLEETKNPKAIPNGMTKAMFLEYKLSQALTESDKVDLLVMGGPEGPGCYCYPNDLLKKNLGSLSQNYDYLVIDNEAGLERISRGFFQEVDHLFILSDASVRSIRSAGRIRSLVKNLKSDVKNMYLVLTKVENENLSVIKNEIEKTGIPFLGVVPSDPLVVDFDFQGKPLFDLPENAPAVQATREILETLSL